MTAIPPLFVSHGAPELILGRSAARKFLQDLPKAMPRPSAIVVASAHWETGRPRVGGAAQPRTMYDLCAGSRGLAMIRYPARGDPHLAGRIADLLRDEGFPALVDLERGLDHGAWTPLHLMFPAADIPVVPLSIQPAQGPGHHLALGRCLAPLVEEGVLVIGSGGVTNNVHACHGRAEDAPAPPWVTRFQAWLAQRIQAGGAESLITALDRAPARRENHPTPEHLLPLFVALGAAGPGAVAKRLHASITHGAFAMDAYSFTPAGARMGADQDGRQRAPMPTMSAR